MFGLMAAASTPDSSWVQLAAVIGVVGLAVLLTISIRGKIARRNAQRPSPREWIEHIKAVRHRRDDVHVQSAELADTARRLAAQLDNKAERLERLIQQADERIARMSEASEARPSATDRAPGAPAPSNDPPRALEPLTRGVYELADDGRTPVEIAQELDEQVGKVELILALRET